MAVRWVVPFVMALCMIGAMLLFLAKSTTINPARQVAEIELTKRGLDPSFGLAEDKRPDDAEKSPVTLVKDSDHDFGTANPFTEMEFEFPIKNGGYAPLEIRNIRTSCTCIKGKAAEIELQPGEHTTIRVSWNTRDTTLAFLQTVTLQTNDPIKPEVVFSVRGTVRAIAAASPDKIDLERAQPHKANGATVLLYSQLWKDFEVTDVTCDVQGFTWDVSAAALKNQKIAKSAKWLRVDFPVGSFPKRVIQGKMSVHLKAKGPVEKKEESTRIVEVAIRGKVLRRLAFYGGGIDGYGVIDLGRSRGGELTARLSMKVRDVNTDLGEIKIGAVPSFVQAVARKTDDKGLYELVITIPKGTPDGYYRGSKKGKLTLTFDHPRIDKTELGLSFFVDRTTQ